MHIEQIDRSACLRETDKTFILALNHPKGVNEVRYDKVNGFNEGAVFVSEIDDGSDTGAQVFAWNKEGYGFKYGDRADKFTDEMTSLCRSIGVVAIDPVMSHVKDKQIPHPVAIEKA